MSAGELSPWAPCPRIIQTSELTATSRLSQNENYWVYNGLDCCLTVEIWEEMDQLYGQRERAIYDFEVALQGPYLEIMQRGFLVDSIARQDAANEVRSRMEKCQAVLDRLARGVCGQGLNPNSPKQLKEFFYEVLKLPEIWISQKGERKLSTNREALEKLDAYLYARPFVSLILRIRDLRKQLEIFESKIDSDGRFRAAYNIAGTETGRPSSSENAFGTGRNAQNIAPAQRYVFVADPGKKLCVIDLEQVEARDVGFFIGCLFDDWKFLDNCESGDLHTNNCKLIWPELGWTGDKKRDREIADRIFYREFSYRDMSKRGGHLSNYYGTAFTAARHLKVPIGVMEEFQRRYCRGRDAAFPGIALYWQWIAEQLQTSQELITPFGRRRTFFGRPGDDTTLREAIAFLPQSTTADRMNLGLWRVWHYMSEVELLAQTFDSITFQYDEAADEAEIIQRALELIRVELRAPNGRLYVVPGEAKVGWNWGAEVTEADQDRARASGRPIPRLNPGGLKKWKPDQPDGRAFARGLSQKRIAA